MAIGSPRQSGNVFGVPGGISVGLQRLLLAVVALFLIPSILFAILNVNSRSPPAFLIQERPVINYKSLWSKLPELIPTYQNVNGTEFVWQIPTDPQPSKILFLAHGCQCRSTFFWDHHRQCMNCTGMPEERTLLLHALARGYAVIAISSTRECWSSSVDGKKVLKVLKYWISEQNLGELPVFGLGASSGGYFISLLAIYFKFKALVLQISSGKFDAMDIDGSYPPTLFVHMPRDDRLAGRISEAREVLTRQGVQNQEVSCAPLEVTPHFFSERIPDLNEELSEKIVRALHQYGCLIPGDEGLLMKVDGRRSEWRMAMKKGKVLSDDEMVKWGPHLQEEMNVAYAYHEFTSLPTQAVFEWFQSSIL